MVLKKIDIINGLIEERINPSQKIILYGQSVGDETVTLSKEF